MKKWVYEILELEYRGRNYYRLWLSGLDIQLKAQVVARVDRIKIAGHFGDHRNLELGIKEVRFHNGLRLYCGVDGADVVVLVLGGDKGSQDADIQRAMDLWALYTKRGKR